MKTINDYFGDMYQKLGSDYKIAQRMEVKPAAVTMMKKRGQVGDETAIKIADILEIDREKVLIAASIARSSGEVKKAWEKISKLSGIAAGFALTINGLELAYAKSLIVCILCKIIGGVKTDWRGFIPTHGKKCPCYKHGHFSKVNLGVLYRQVKTPPAGNFPFISLHGCVSPI